MVRRWRWAGPASAAIFALGGVARAETGEPTVAETLTSDSPSVAATSHPIRVGDVIMAPSVAANDHGRVARRAPERGGSRRGAWYGQPVLVADALAYGFIAFSAEYDQVASLTLPIGIGTFLLVPPLVHLGVGQWRMALASGGMRLGFPIGAALAGVALSCGDSSDSCGESVLGFTIAGMLGATLLDAAFLSYEKAPPRSAIHPALHLGRSHALLGASGRF